MRNAKIVLVAEWDGWCGACAVERPLVLTRTGRLGLRTWLTAPVTESRPLTLTCRLCGNSTLVPAEQDDPPVLVEPDEAPARVLAPAPLVSVERAPTAPPALPVEPTLPAPVAEPASVLAPASPAVPVHRSLELDQARQALGSALGALLVQRNAQVPRVTVTPSLPVPAVAPPALPQQRTASSDADGLATLQLLADGLDLLSSSRA